MGENENSCDLKRCQITRTSRQRSSRKQTKITEFAGGQYDARRKWWESGFGGTWARESKLGWSFIRDCSLDDTFWTQSAALEAAWASSSSSSAVIVVAAAAVEARSSKTRQRSIIIINMQIVSNGSRRGMLPGFWVCVPTLLGFVSLKDNGSERRRISRCRRRAGVLMMASRATATAAVFSSRRFLPSRQRNPHANHTGGNGDKTSRGPTARATNKEQETI